MFSSVLAVGDYVLVIILFLGLVSYKFLSLTKLNGLARKSVKEREAVFLDCDMSSKLRELLDDPLMTTQKWKEWLPIFESADAEVRRKCNLNLGRNADFIRAIISNGDRAGL